MIPKKFRAWDKENKEFIDNLTILDLLHRINGAWDDMEFSQFTGLLDKNGVLIYEGDIIEVRYNGGWTEIGVAEYWEFLGKYVFNEVSDDPSEPKGLFDFNDACPMFVIGNIYENPELLK